MYNESFQNMVTLYRGMYNLELGLDAGHRLVLRVFRK
jgi:hypothetical protein